jgi:hypothetical protein
MYIYIYIKAMNLLLSYVDCHGEHHHPHHHHHHQTKENAGKHKEAMSLLSGHAEQKDASACKRGSSAGETGGLLLAKEAVVPREKAKSAWEKGEGRPVGPRARQLS